jgi:hypothetical protein
MLVMRDGIQDASDVQGMRKETWGVEEVHCCLVDF